jgi:MFS transporter, MHS family, proline/betaine transporter
MRRMSAMGRKRTSRLTGATAIFGGLTPYLAQLLMERTGSPMVPGAMIAVVALCVLPLFVRMPETFAGRAKWT